MTIRKKLLAGFTVISAFCLGVGITSLVQVSRLKSGIVSLSDGTIPTLGYLKSVSQDMYAIKVAVRSLANERGIDDEAYYERQLSNIAKARSRYAEALRLYDTLPKTDEERRLYGNAIALLGDAASFNDSVLRLAARARVEKGDARDAIFAEIYDLVSGDRRLAFDNFEKSLAELIAYDQNLYASEVPKAVLASADAAMIAVITASITAFLIAVLLGVFFGRGIAGSLEKVSGVLGKVAEGDLSEHFEAKSRDEFKRLSEALGMVIKTVSGLSVETQRLTDRAIAGNLTARGDVGLFKGAYRGILGGVNNIMDALSGFIENMPAPAMIIDGDFNVVYMNRAATALGGSTLEEILSRKMKCYEFFKTNDCKGERCACARAMQGGSAATSETSAIPAGARYEISYTGVPVRDRSGAIVGALEVITDQTEIKRAERVMSKISGFQTTEIAKLESYLRKVADGDFTADFSVAEADADTEETRRQLELVAEGLNRTVAAIGETLAQVSVTVDQVSSGSEQVAQASQALSQGATEQASSLEEITASITAIAGQTRENADHATKVDEVSKASMTGAMKGDAQMRELVTAVGEINANAESIRKVILVIDDIAFQINLLALNANVEAARAGKYGKGFAVVADEVRNLAVRSAGSVRDTTRMIEDTVSSVARVNSLVNATASRLAEILSGATEVVDLAERVCSASREQAAGLGQVSVGLSQIEQVTQSNTASAEESAAAAEELSSQARMLKDMIARFRLRGAREGSVRRHDGYMPQFVGTAERAAL